MQGSDFYSGSALGGAGSGAASGAMLGSTFGPYGTAIGGVVGGAAGLVGGAFANDKRRETAEAQSRSIDQVIANMNAMSANSYDSYIKGLNKVLSFYGPATSRWNYLYGMPGQQNFQQTPSIAK